VNKKIVLSGLVLASFFITPSHAGLGTAHRGYKNLNKLMTNIMVLLDEGAEKINGFLERQGVNGPEDLSAYFNAACIPGLLGELANGLAEGYAVYAMASPNPSEITKSAIYSTLGSAASSLGSGSEMYIIGKRVKDGVSIKKGIEQSIDMLTDLTRIGTALYFTRSDAKKFFDARQLAMYNSRADRTMRRRKVLEFLYLGISFGLFPLIRFLVRPLEIKRDEDREDQACITGAIVRLVQSLFEVYRRHHRFQLDFGEYEDMDPEDLPQHIIVYRETGEPIIATLPRDSQEIS